MKYENCDILSNSKKVVDTTVTLSISVTPCAGMYAAVRLVPTAMLLVCREQAPTRCPVKYTSTYTLDMRHFVGVVHIMRPLSLGLPDALKIDTPVTPALCNVHTNVGLPLGQTDGQEP